MSQFIQMLLIGFSPFRQILKPEDKKYFFFWRFSHTPGADSMILIRILIEFRIKILFPDSLPKVDWNASNILASGFTVLI